MNLYFRLLIILFKSKFASQIGVLDKSHLRFRAWPFDCDINFHLTNARYFTLGDLCRIYYMGQVGFLFNLIKRKWLPVVQAQEISYYKPINPFQRFEVITSFSHWDDKYWYMEHQFVTGDRLCAVLQVRGVFVHGKSIVSIPDIFALAGEKVEAPDIPVNVEYWKNLIEVKRRKKPG